MANEPRLYHGSKAGIDGPISPIGSSVNDFGRGFYLGDEPSQPLTLICRGERPTFYTCEVDLAGLRVRLRHLHDGFFFQEVLERDAKGGGHEA